MKIINVYKRVGNSLKIGIYKFFNSWIAKKIFGRILQIDTRTISSITVNNRCINIFTDHDFYKFQLYGDSIKKDLRNRKLFPVCDQSILSPIKVYKRTPFTIIMPILKQPINHEEAACYILCKLKKSSYKTAFKVEDYPFIMEGLSILKKSDSGKLISEKLFEYLQKQRGSIVCVGIVHGDFHRDNIMCKGSLPVMIDFDCSRKDDIQAVDALYYILEEVRRKNKYNNPLLEDWLLIYKNIDMMYGYKCIEYADIDLKFGLIISLLERISQEQRYDCCFINKNENSVKKISYALIVEKYL